MREIDETFAAKLAADETTLCACWRFERMDGAVFGATDHDRAVVVDGLVHEPAVGVEGAVLASSRGLAPGYAAARGALSLAFLQAEHVDAGLWDGARVDVWRVDWRAPEHRVCVWSGKLSEITRQGEAFAAELVSLKADLERSIGRVYARTCDAEVGDPRCGVDLDDPDFRSDGVVGAVLAERRFLAGALGGFASDWFTGGMLSWMSGANAGRDMRIAQHGASEIELARAPRHAIAPGDAFIARAGCDKAFAMCRAKFGNHERFRGFPHMPGPEAMLAGPSSDRANDGGSRS